MTIYVHIKSAIFLLCVAAIPATIQLFCHGMWPPPDHPFGIDANWTLRHEDSIVWVDARSKEAFSKEHIAGAININPTTWDTALPELFGAYQPGKTIVVYCTAGCSESDEIANRVRNLGLDPVKVLEGGIEAWKRLSGKL